MIADVVLQTQNMFLEKVLPILQKRSKSSYIGLAVLLVLMERTYSFFSVPKYLRRFPTVSYFSTMKSFYNNDSIFARNKKLVVPLTSAGHRIYVSKVPITWTIFITDPVIARTFLLKTENFPKSHDIFNALSETSPVVQFIGKNNVAMSNGDIWKRQRKIMNPAFHKAVPLKTFGNTVTDLFEIIDNNDGPLPIIQNMKRLTLDILGLSIFGFDFQALKGDPQGWTKTYNLILNELFNPWVNFFAKFDFLIQYISPVRRRSMKATNDFNAMLDVLIDQRRQEVLDGKKKNIPDIEKDLLTLMIEADVSEGVETTTVELRQNIALLFLAGHDTTAHTLSFCLYNLAKNKHVQKKLRDEILEVLGDDPVDVIPTAEDLKNMKYLNMVIKENLRRSGPADKILARETVSDIELGGIVIPKDSRVSVDIVAIHMNPTVWHDPESFIPERFEDGGEHDQHTGLTYVPFSNGTRQCLGMNFSLAEQRVFLSMLLKRYEIDIPTDSEHYISVKYDRPFNFAPESLKLRFTKRF